MMHSVNPYSGATIARWPESTASELEALLVLAGKAFAKWEQERLTHPEASMKRRSLLLHELAKVLVMRKESLARCATEEMGKPYTQALAEVEKCASVCRHYATEGMAYLQPEPIATEARTWVSYEPLGTILGVMPWNFPYWQVMRFAAPTLMAGNTVVVKHASNVQGCARALADCFDAAGFAKGCYVHLPITSQLVANVIRHPVVKGVSVTGSEAAGAAVACAAGACMKPTLLELGGSNAFIILADADVDHSADLAIAARMQNNGQSCIAAKRIIVVESIAQAFAERLTTSIQSLCTGDPLDLRTEVGPLARPELAAALHRQVEASVAMGAQLRCGGHYTGALYHPTLLSHVAPGMPVWDEETFGPVAALATATTDAQAIALANTTRFGLGATLCTRDPERAIHLGRGLRDGAVFVNEMVKSDPRLPFGGTGLSGYGRELGRQGIQAFTNAKTWYIAPR